MTTIFNDRDCRQYRRFRLLACALALLLPLGGLACGDRGPAARERAVTSAEFIDIVVALREAERAVTREVEPDSTEVEFERRKQEILERHGASEEGVRRFIERHQRRPAVLSAVWDSISHRLRVEARDAPPPGPY